MASIVNTVGDIKAMEAANEKMGPVPEGLSEKDRAAEVEKRRSSDYYQTAIRDYGIGSKNQMVVQAITGVLQGLVSGNITQAVAGGVGPLMAQTIKAYTTNPDGTTNTAANLMAHAVWGAVAAQMSGGNAAAGAGGAFSAELAARYITENYYNAKTPEEISKLSESDRQEISLLSTLAAGAAGGVVGDSTAAVTTGAQTGKNAVENNYLSSKQIDNWSAEMKSCQAGGGDCGSVIKKYEELSTAQQKQLISDCATSPATCQQKYGDVLADSMAVKQALDRAMGEDIPIKMVYDLTATWAHQMDADGIVASNKVSEQIMAKYGLDQAQADIIAGVALSALGGVSKAGKGSPLPTPKATIAQNGLVYKSNPKHTPGQPSNRANAGIEPQDSLKLFDQSIPSTKQYPNKEVRFAVDSQGNVHRFVGTNGEYHWNGSTADKNALTSDQIPTAIQKQLGVRIK